MHGGHIGIGDQSDRHLPRRRARYDGRVRRHRIDRLPRYDGRAHQRVGRRRCDIVGRYPSDAVRLGDDVEPWELRAVAAALRFRAMGSDAHVIVVGGRPGLIEGAAARIADLEAKWSRFLPDSEVSEMNRRAGAPVTVSADTVLLVRRAIEAWRISGGAFDPTLLGAIVHAGYDRSFELLPVAPPPPGSGPAPLGIGAAEIAVEGSMVQVPRRTGFDPGGVGKGLAADVVCAELLAAGAAGACINLGGDVRVSGDPPEGSGWTVAVEHPRAGAPIALLGVADGAVATSTTLRRRWRVGAEERHHVIDPQTGLPSTTDLTAATVVAADAWRAEVYAKAVLLAGAAHPFDILGGTGAEAIAVDDRGAVHASTGLSAYLGGATVVSGLPPPPYY